MAEIMPMAYDPHRLGVAIGLQVAPAPVATIPGHPDRPAVAVFGLIFMCGLGCDEVHNAGPMLLDLETAAAIVAQLTEQTAATGQLPALQAKTDQIRREVRPHIITDTGPPPGWR